MDSVDVEQAQKCLSRRLQQGLVRRTIRKICLETHYYVSTRLFIIRRMCFKLFANVPISFQGGNSLLFLGNTIDIVSIHTKSNNLY